MDNWRSYLPFLAVVAGGLAIGVVLAALWDDGNTDGEQPTTPTAVVTTTTA